MQQSSIRPSPPFAAVVGPVIIAHRGGSLEAPENTVASIRHGVAAGADWQELDVTLTSDEQVVVIHDDTLERTTNGRGRVESKTLAELRTLSAGRPSFTAAERARLGLFGAAVPEFGERFTGERIPTLKEVLAVPECRLMIELKKNERGPLLAEKVVDAVGAAGMHGRVAIGSFEQDLLEAVHYRDPTIPLIGILEDPAEIPRKLMLPVVVLAVRVDYVEEALAAVPPGVAVWAWTAYSVDMAKSLAERGVHGIITDAPQAVVAALRAPQDVRLP